MIDQDTGARLEVSCPIPTFDAPIDVDMKLSYEWLARQNIHVYLRKHGLLFGLDCHTVWVAGEKVGVPTLHGDMRVCQVKQGRFRVDEPQTYDYWMRNCFATLETRKSDRNFSIEDDALSLEWDPNEVLLITHH